MVRKIILGICIVIGLLYYIAESRRVALKQCMDAGIQSDETCLKYAY